MTLTLTTRMLRRTWQGMMGLLRPLAVALLLLSLVLGCRTYSPAHTKHYDFTTMDQMDVYRFLAYTNGMSNSMFGVQVTQQTYCIPTVDWIKEVYAPGLHAFLSNNGIGAPWDPDNNCQKYSAYGVVAGFVLHLHGEGPSKSCLAIGITDYTQSLFLRHSINFFVARDRLGALVLVYFEPQTHRIVPGKDIADWTMVRM